MRLVFLWRVRLVPDTGTEPGYFDTFIGPRHDLDAYVEAENKAGAKWRVRQRHASCDMPPWTQSVRTWRTACARFASAWSSVTFESAGSSTTIGSPT